MTNLDDLAKLAPFTIHGSEAPWSEAGGQWIGLHALVAIANEWAELRKDLWSPHAKVVQENAELRVYRERTEAALRDHCAGITALLDELGWDKPLQSEMDALKESGLWRDPATKEATDGR